MRLTRRGRAVAYPLAAVLAFGAGATAHRWDPVARDLTCRTHDVGEQDSQASALLAVGWRGDPTDHAERLYSPACR